MEDTRLDRIENKVDKTLESINEINVTLTEQHLSLKEHMRRTEIAEERLDHLDNNLDEIQKHVHNIQFLGKVIKWLTATTGFILVILQIIKLIGK